MRVLFINRMLSMERGGGETFDLEISRHLEELGWEVSYLSGLPLLGSARTPLDHARSYTIRTPYFGWFPWDVVKGGWRLRVTDFRCFEWRAAAWAAKREQEFDMVQVCELPAFVAEWKRRGCRTPVVMRLTAPNFIDPGQGLRKADRVIASGMTIEEVHKNGSRPDCVDIPNGVDLQRFTPGPSSFRSRNGLAEDAVVILYVARFQAFKNHALLVSAFEKVAREVPGSVLVLAGSGPLQARVEEQCRTCGLAERVRFLKEVPFEELPEVYGGADIKVVSSDYESFCFAAIEAMAMGLPLATTDCGWVPRLIDGGKGGLISPVGDAPALADSLVTLAKDPELRRRLGEWNRQRAVAEHGWDRSARKLDALYRELLEPTP